MIMIVLVGGVTLNSYAQDYKEKQAIVLSDKEKPKFPGGETELKKYLSLNLRYPNIAMERQIEGEVLVGFLIDTAGKVSDIKILKGLGNGCDDEAIRVVRNMPQWSPARIKGTAVTVAYRLPVIFELPQLAPTAAQH